MAKPKIACVVGTRPDAIKSAPVVLELQRFDSDFETVLVSTGQHREMLDQALSAFGLAADHELAIMQHGQSLAEITTKALGGLDRLFADIAPDYVVAQGDTTSTFCASLAAFYRRIPFGHVEAGLRTPRIDNPFPEEFNRRATGMIATHHFPPTAWAAENLRREGVPEDRILVTGNTGIDAVLQMAERHPEGWFADRPERVVLLTTHRRDNWGEPQRQIALAARELADRHEDTLLVVAMHRNPQVRETLRGVLEGHPRTMLIEPPEYERFVKLMQRSTLILTDSGGVQEEAPAFGVPVLVLRETTERPEGVEAGAAKLVGTDYTAIVTEGTRLLSDPAAHRAMSQVSSPYGDGRASARIRHVIGRALGVETPEAPPWT
ncbi:MAG: UDP-N-acetylglucosamine 2-epimerase (non-hydrolyzing) [Armatimonadetes bacterium]|nr:UDP-N-acetylglucosamine 2-epimerase (non-hydrolyzing) [Armatimonadota bacterium]